MKKVSRLDKKTIRFQLTSERYRLVHGASGNGEEPKSPERPAVLE
jgi:hypothetical protein